MAEKMWVFKYKPNNLKDMVLNENIRPKLQKAIKEVPNLLLYSTPGLGKGTFTDILTSSIECDRLWINASDETGLDMVRERVRPFASSMSMSGIKIVVLNEADSLTSGMQGSQKMLRQLMEDVQSTCRFIFLCNYEGNIIPEIKSRCQVMKLEAPPKQEIGRLILKILKAENIEYKAEHIKNIIEKCYPDIRKTINVLQENVIDGKLTGSKINASEALWDKITEFILKGELEDVRDELRTNYIEYPLLYEHLYNNAGRFLKPGNAIIKIGEALYRDSTVAIKEINFIAFVCDLIYGKIV